MEKLILYEKEKKSHLVSQNNRFLLKGILVRKNQLLRSHIW